jgi:hypothetical protein
MQIPSDYWSTNRIDAVQLGRAWHFRFSYVPYRMDIRTDHGIPDLLERYQYEMSRPTPRLRSESPLVQHQVDTQKKDSYGNVLTDLEASL